jgi:hypothetical protein
VPGTENLSLVRPEKVAAAPPISTSTASQIGGRGDDPAALAVADDDRLTRPVNSGQDITVVTMRGASPGSVIVATAKPDYELERPVPVDAPFELAAIC